MLPGLYLPMPSFDTAVADTTASFLSYGVNPTTASTYTLTSVSWGTLASHERVLVFFNVASTGTITLSSVSIGSDSSPTQLLDTGSSTRRSYAYLGNPTGTSGTITVNWTTSGTTSCIAAYKLSNLQSTTPVASGFDDAGDPLEVIATVPANGCAVGFVSNGNANASTTWAWQLNASSIYTENFDDVTADDRAYSGALYNNTGSVLTSASHTADFSATPSNHKLLVTTFR